MAMNLMSRRRMLGLSGRAAAGAWLLSRAPLLGVRAWAASGPTPTPGTSVAPGSAGSPLLVVVFLRGGADGLSFVAPLTGDDRALYEAARPTLKLAASGDHGLLKLDDRLGLHPAATALHGLYGQKKLAVIPAAGLTADTRSHFDAQAYVELGTPQNKGTPSGWLARHLEGRGLGKHGGSFDAIAVGGLAPTSLKRFDQAVVINSLGGFNLGGPPRLRADQEIALAALYAGAEPGAGGAPGAWLERLGTDALSAVRRLEMDSQIDSLAGGGGSAAGDYPKGEIGGRLQSLAQLVRLEKSIQAATVDMGGWDTHKYQGKGPEGHFANQVRQLSDSLQAFYGEMQSLGREVTIVVQTEFGRRLKENANQGTDHGHGGVMFVLGERVAGGRVHGEWPGLATEHLYERADVAVANDYRRVVAEVLIRGFGERKLGAVFPGYRGYRPLGVFKPS